MFKNFFKCPDSKWEFLKKDLSAYFCYKNELHSPRNTKRLGFFICVCLVIWFCCCCFLLAKWVAKQTKNISITGIIRAECFRGGEKD